jgi:hypothetical protein
MNRKTGTGLAIALAASVVLNGALLVRRAQGPEGLPPSHRCAGPPAPSPLSPTPEPVVAAAVEPPLSPDAEALRREVDSLRADVEACRLIIADGERAAAAGDRTPPELQGFRELQARIDELALKRAGVGVDLAAGKAVPFEEASLDAVGQARFPELLADYLDLGGIERESFVKRAAEALARLIPIVESRNEEFGRLIEANRADPEGAAAREREFHAAFEAREAQAVRNLTAFLSGREGVRFALLRLRAGPIFERAAALSARAR